VQETALFLCQINDGRRRGNMSIRCGVDIVDITRIQTAILNHGDTFLTRVYTSNEQKACRLKGKGEMASFAARFAAKEAVAKALGTGIGAGASFIDIEIIQDLSGSPSVLLHHDAKHTFEQMGGIELAISLSHEKTYAVAQAVLLIK